MTAKAMDKKYQIITFYEFKELNDLEKKKELLKKAMADHSIYGTLIIAPEGFNSTVCGRPGEIKRFIGRVATILGSKISVKSSFHDEIPFQRQKVKIKKEIVTLKKEVDLARGGGTHVTGAEWNKLIGDPETFVLDARNDYEHRIGTFRGAVNPQTESFGELPDFVEKNLDPAVHKRIAMFCTGGIRCEKFAPYLKEKGFAEVYQLGGGILRYLEEVPEQESLWEGECFVFDERISVDEKLKKGLAKDLSIDENRKK